jgi:RNA polymerase sigma-70 factor, ECF subfamily
MEKSMSTDEIWTGFSDQLFAFIIKRVKNEDVAHDILQNVFEKIHSKLDSLRSDAKLKSWLYQITRNAIIDYFRARRFEDVSELSNISDSDEDNAIYEAAEGCVRRFLNHIPKDQMEAIKAVYYEGRSQKELAEELDISYTALKSRVQRGRNKLEELIRDCCVRAICTAEDNCGCIAN